MNRRSRVFRLSSWNGFNAAVHVLAGSRLLPLETLVAKPQELRSWSCRSRLCCRGGAAEGCGVSIGRAFAALHDSKHSAACAAMMQGFPTSNWRFSTLDPTRNPPSRTLRGVENVACLDEEPFTADGLSVRQRLHGGWALPNHWKRHPRRGRCCWAFHRAQAMSITSCGHGDVSLGACSRSSG